MAYRFAPVALQRRFFVELRFKGSDHVQKAVRQEARSGGDYTFVTADWLH